MQIHKRKAQLTRFSKALIAVSIASVMIYEISGNGLLEFN